MRLLWRLLRLLLPRPQRAYATTGPAHGEEVEFKCDDEGDTLRDTSPYVRDVSFAIDGQVVDVTGFKAASDWRTFLAGLKGATITISGVLDDTADVGSSVVLLGAEGDTRGIQYGPLGITSGEPKFTAETLVTNVTATVGVEAESTFSASFQVTGAVSITTYA